MAVKKSKIHPKLARAQLLVQAGNPIEALALLNKVCNKDKRNVDANFLKGLILSRTGKLEEAIDSFKQVIKIKPRHTLAFYNLGNLYQNAGNIKAAISAYSSAYKLDPGNPDLINVLARSQAAIGNFNDAIELYQLNHKLRPDNPDVISNIATACFLNGELEQAVLYHRRAIAIQPNASYFDGLGVVLCQQGKYSEAIEAHREAAKLQPDNLRFHSNLLLSLNYLPEDKQSDFLQEHKNWDRNHQINREPYHNYSNTKDAGRRLRVAYVSPDLRTHSVAYFLEPLLENHNKEVVEIYCYACTSHHDETTERLKLAADHWRDISGLNDDQAISRIVNDKIDILVDLSGHTAKNRLAIFSAKPAPVQVTWLGYPATTGLEAIDYRITDELADPIDNSSSYTEQLVRVPGCFLCYKPPALAPAVQPSPAEQNGFITFGSFNNLAKINEGVIKLWSELINSVNNSRLLIKNPSLTDLPTAERYMSLFGKYGVTPNRIDLLGLAPTIEDHLNTYGLIDIALDTFPYNGTTTTCEALYMGTPVITLAGKLHANRVGKTILENAGLSELVAETSDDFVAIAKSLAGDFDKLSIYNNTIRSRMYDSSLCDGKVFADKIEQSYREMWQTFCSSENI